MDNLEIAKALFGTKPQQPNGGQTTTTYGIAVGNSENGLVRVNLGGDTVSADDEQTVEIETTFAVKEGDAVITSLIGADGTGKAPVVTGVVGRGDEQEAEIKSVTNYVWNDEHGLHVSTEERSVQGANILLDSDSLDIRNGNSNSESDQTVYASFGKEVTVGSRRSGYAIGEYSHVFGQLCVATGDYSHAEGLQTRALGNYAHAEGQGAQAYTFCHAEGQGTMATGNTGHAEGGNTLAAGDFSHAEGYIVKASSDYQHAQGKLNVVDSNDKYADIVGNGNSTQGVRTYSNAYNLDWDGNAEFQGEVYVGGCTPNGETPYPVVRYNTSNSQSEYYNGSSWAQVPSKRSAGWDELWTNEDETSNFAAQTVSLDLSGWAFIAIVTRFSTTHNYKTINIIRVGDTCPMDTGNLFSTMYTAKRSAAVSESGITFSTGYRNTTGTIGAEYCIPVAIYGVVASVAGVLKTASGSVITVSDALSKAVASLVVDINAVQSGSGDPSPTNVRPITGFSEVKIYRESAYDPAASARYTVSLSSAGTVYGGSLNVRTGVLTVTHGFITLVGGNEATYSNNGHTINSTRCIVTISGKANGVDNMTSNRFAYTNSGDYYGRMLGRAASNNVEFYLPPSVSTNVADQKAWFADNPTEVCFELATPQTIQLSPTIVRMLAGNNALWADSGDSEVQYWAEQ